MSESRTFDWVSRHDPRSLAYPVRALLRAGAPRTYKFWTPGPILDQGAEGACVGHGWTDEATAFPVVIDFAKENLGNDDKGKPWPKDAQAFAFALYAWAQRHDETAGENYEGTSVIAGAAGMKKVGFLSEYRWALSMDDIIDTIVSLGPVVLGMDWYDSMYDAPKGELKVSGEVVGGHCILALGYDPARVFTDGSITAAIALQNSWGPDWGKGGVAWIKVSALMKILAKTGEACVPVVRADPAAGSVTPTPVPVPVPTPNPVVSPAQKLAAALPPGWLTARHAADNAKAAKAVAAWLKENGA